MNKKELEYKGFIGSVHYSESDGEFYGMIENIPHQVSYEGSDLYDLEYWFKANVDDYLKDKDNYHLISFLKEK